MSFCAISGLAYRSGAVMGVIYAAVSSGVLFDS